MCQIGVWLNLVYMCCYSSLSTKHVGCPIMTLNFTTRYSSIRPRAPSIILNIYYFRFNIFKKGTFKGLFEKKGTLSKACNFIKIGTLAQVFSCEFFKNTFFYRTSLVSYEWLSSFSMAVLKRIDYSQNSLLLVDTKWSLQTAILLFLSAGWILERVSKNSR